MATDPADLLVDAVHYEQFRSPFHGDGAQFACLYAVDTPIGIGPVHARCTQLTRLITTTTLQLWIRHGETWQAIPRQRMTSHPAAALESARWRVGGSELAVSARTVYADARTAWHEQVIVNAGATAIAIECAACGQIDPDRSIDAKRCQAWMPEARPRPHFVAEIPAGVRCGYSGQSELPNPALQIEALAGIAAARRLELPLWAAGLPDPCPRGTLHYAFTSGPRRLAPGERLRLLFRIAYVPTWHAAPAPRWPAAADAAPDLDALQEAASRALQRRLGAAAGDSQLLRARYALLRCGYQGVDGAYGPVRSCLCTPGITAFSVTFFWDALFSCAALSAFDPAYARDAMQVPLRQVRGRYLSRTWDIRLARPEKVPQPQAPVASWALAHHLALNDDPGHLAAMYPQLVALHRFWQTQDADGDGLPEWSYTGLNADNGPHYLGYMPWQVHNVFLPPIASVSLASFMHLDALLLAGFADRLGRSDEAVAWRERARFLAERLHAVCWHAGDGMFYDYDHHVQEHNRVATHLVFWPLWAGVPMDAAVKRRLIEEHLLDPRKFAGPIPFPTCAYDDGHYDAESYWSGRSWPHITYWLIELLVREGYRAQAVACADRWLAWQSGHAGHREAVATDAHLSEHCEYGEASYRTGRDFDYNWAAAAVALLRERRYDRFVPLAREG